MSSWTLRLGLWICSLGVGLFPGCSRQQEPEPRKETVTLSTKAGPPKPATFAPTQASETLAPTAAPGGLVWIVGGGVWMGSADPTVGGHCHEPMDDARPIH